MVINSNRNKNTYVNKKKTSELFSDKQSRQFNENQ